MKDVLVVIDMQKDFIDGTLGTKEAAKIVPAVVQKVRDFQGDIVFTRDTHLQDYMQTQEGKKLPIPHCIKGTAGWQICEDLQPFAEGRQIFDKETFGSVELGEFLQKMDQQEGLSSVMFVGLCTDICVISNALLVKAFVPQVPILVDAACCAGVTPQSHDTALNAMRSCQIEIMND